MNKINTSICLSLLATAVVVTVAGCDKKPQTPVPQTSQPTVSQRIADLIKRAQSGDAEAQADMGAAYAHGDEGLPRDATKASEFLRTAAEKGIAKAQYELGQLYEKGDGVPQDSAKAVDLVKQSAKNGYGKAQATLGEMYAKGKGVTRDDVLAYAWSSLAASRGEAEAKQTQDSVALTATLREEAERLKAKWQRGMELVRERREALVPSEPTKPGGAK